MLVYFMARNLVVNILICIGSDKLWSTVEGFNVNTDQPTVLKGKPGTQFGYSVELWKDLSDNYIAVVGAPSHNPLWLHNTNYTLGGVSFCSLPLGSPSAGTPCTGTWPAAPDNPPLLWPDQNLNYGAKASFGLGATISVPTTTGGGQITVCSPRYPNYHKMKDSKDASTRGVCFSFNGPDDLDPIVHALMQSSDMGWSETGFSIATSHVNIHDETVYLGTPGNFPGGGRILASDNGDIRYNSNPTSSENSTIHRGWAIVIGKFKSDLTDGEILAVSSPREASPSGTPLAGKVTFYTTQLKKLPKTLSGSELGSKFGYTLSTGDLDNDGISDLVVAAPFARAIQGATVRHTAGKVFIYRKPLEPDSEWLLPQELSGHVTNGLFGISLLCTDLDNDGTADLLVGAPNDGNGAVYIYNGRRGEGVSTEAQVIRGSAWHPGDVITKGFGFSLGGGVDVDGNNFPDIIIGSQSTSTVVFLRSAPVIKVLGVMGFKKKNVSLGKNTRTEVINGQNETVNVFDFEMSIFYDTSAKLDTFPDIKATFEMLVDVDRPQPRLFFLISMNDKQKNKYSRDLRVQHIKNKSRAQAFTVYMVPGRQEASEVKSLVKVTLKKGSAEKALQSNLTVVLDPLTSTVYNRSMKMSCNDLGTCFGLPDMKVNITAGTVKVGSSTTGKFVSSGSMTRLNITLITQTERAYNVVLSIIYPKCLTFSHAIGGHLYPKCERKSLLHENSIDEKSLYDGLNCTFSSIFPKNLQVDLGLMYRHDPFKVLQQIKELRNTSSKSSLIFRASVNSDIRDMNPADNVQETNASFMIDFIPRMSNWSLPESVVGYTNKTVPLDLILSPTTEPLPPSAVGPKIQHTYTVINQGVTPILAMSLEINVPTHLNESGHPVLFFHQPMASTGNITCQMHQINSTKIKLISETKLSKMTKSVPGNHKDDGEQRESSFMTIRQSYEIKGKPSPDYIDEHRLNCKNSFCTTIRCSISEPLMMSQSVSVTVLALVVIGTLDSRNLGNVLLSSEAHLNIIEPQQLLPFKDVIITKTVTTRITLTKFQVDVSYLLVISSSIIMGTLIVLFLVFILWKIGFFKRNKIIDSAIIESPGEDHAIEIDCILEEDKVEIDQQSLNEDEIEIEDSLKQGTVETGHSLKKDKVEAEQLLKENTD